VRFETVDEIHSVQSFKDYQYLHEDEIKSEPELDPTKSLLWWTFAELKEIRNTSKEELLSTKASSLYLKAYVTALQQLRKESKISASTWKKFAALQAFRAAESLDERINERKRNTVKKIVSSTVRTYRAMRRSVAEASEAQHEESLLKRMLTTTAESDADNDRRHHDHHHQRRTDGGLLPKLSEDDADAVAEALRQRCSSQTAACRRWALAQAKADALEAAAAATAKAGTATARRRNNNSDDKEEHQGATEEVTETECSTSLFDESMAEKI
jgi:hypothetical protein